MQRLGERVYAEGENDEGESWGNAEEARGKRKKQGETKIPQSRGACGRESIVEKWILD